MPYPVSAVRGKGGNKSASALLNSLISYWKLDEASGTRNDAHGANHLTDNNTVTQAAGRIGNAGQFTSANSEYLSIADNAALSTGDIDFTIAFWVYYDSNFSSIITKGTSETTAGREYVVKAIAGGNNIVFQVSDGASETTLFGGPNLALGSWYYVIVWHDSVGDTINRQVNDGGVDSVAWSTGVQDGAGTFRLGVNCNADGGSFHDGRIDEVGFWTRVLTAAERTSLYNAGAGLAYPFS